MKYLLLVHWENRWVEIGEFGDYYKSGSLFDSKEEMKVWIKNNVEDPIPPFRVVEIDDSEPTRKEKNAALRMMEPPKIRWAKSASKGAWIGYVYDKYIYDVCESRIHKHRWVIRNMNWGPGQSIAEGFFKSLEEAQKRCQQLLDEGDVI